MTNTVQRSEQFGTAYLRLAKKLQPGYVLTIEPGIYFIPALIDQWKNSKMFKEYINYERVEEYRDFGGIRIEDNVLVTDKGHRVLGKPIPKTIKEVEDIMNTPSHVKYSRFIRAIFVSLISLGHSASQAPVLVQLPNPSLSISATIFFTLSLASTCPGEEGQGVKSWHRQTAWLKHSYMLQHKHRILYILMNQKKDQSFPCGQV